MSNTHKFLVPVLVAAGSLMLAACGQGPTPFTLPAPPPPPPPPPPPVAGTVTTVTFCGTTTSDASTNCTTPPTTTGGSNASGFVNRVDIYQTANAADRAIIFLHGAGGSGCGMAHDLGLYANDVAPQCSLTNSDVNGTWLSDNKVIAVFPTGQAVPSGTATWNNWVMDSGQDDRTMLQSLAAYVRTTYGVSHVYLLGHSNGGMMVNRMWCESPLTFDGYVSLAGPASTHYLNGDPHFLAQCAPSASGSGADLKPYFGMVGAQDAVLCDTASVTGCAGAFNAQTWTLNPSETTGAGFLTYNNTTLIGEYNQQQARIADVAGCNELLGSGTPDQTPNPLNIFWTNCNGLLKLQQVVSASHWISYAPGTSTPDPTSLEVASGAGVPTASGLNTSLLDKFVIPFLNGISAP